ncbi:MAG: PIN domain-containing protein [Selenomonadaceae bacterium]|nr:PIN domain-containing protein [Selenomonadaceae bacterium]
MRYLLDTNVIIDILRGNENVVQRYQIETIKKNKIFICPIVYYEVIRGFKIGGATKKLENFLQLYKNWTMLTFDEDVSEKAADLYEKLHNGQTIEDNDLYIAANAMVNGCTLVTANTRHFGRVEGLNFVNWRAS